MDRLALAGDSPCPSPGEYGDVVYVASEQDGVGIDPCGGGAPPSPSESLAAGLTIDFMTTSLGYSRSHVAGGSIDLFGSASTYTLSDGSGWSSGAGTVTTKHSNLAHVEVADGTVRYYLYPPSDGILYKQTDYDAGNHSAQGSLGTSQLIVLEAQIGSHVAKARGAMTVLSNDPTSYGEPRFNYYSAARGSTVPFELTYTLAGSATWQTYTFDTTFQYTGTGRVDFAHPTSVPPPVVFFIRGPWQVPPNTSVAYTAVAWHADGTVQDISAAATWSVEPAGTAGIFAGVLTTRSFTVDDVPITIRATYVLDGVTLSAEKTVKGRAARTDTEPDAWPSFQADPRHTGSVARSYEPTSFTRRWERSLAPGGLSPLVSADGRVFVSYPGYFSGGQQLFALDAASGATLWSKAFGSVFSVNPPAYAYGNVYVQTGNHEHDTWLWAFDAATGQQKFRSPHAAQWERYYAPTISDGTVYVDGGSYGGMYAFDAFSGTRRWFAELPQYDQWTPGVDGDLAYAYVGEDVPGLYVLDRRTGGHLRFIPDTNFHWNGWSMNLAPVILDDGDVVAIHDGRLIRFSFDLGRVLWERAGGFSGQPSVAHGVLYAAQGTRLVALDPVTGAERWAWTGGQVYGPFIVSDSHIFLSTNSSVYAVDLLTHETVWHYPAAGPIALGDDNLYIAQGGSVIAIAAEPIGLSSPQAIEIQGPSEAIEMTSVPFTAVVRYADGRVRDRTRSTTWSVGPSTYCAIDTNGLLRIAEMLDLSQDVTITARYTEAGTSVESRTTVRLNASVGLTELVERNRLEAIAIQSEVVVLLDQAIARESAILRVLGVPTASDAPEPAAPFPAAIMRALSASRVAKALTLRALDQLDEGGNTPVPQP